MKKIIFLLLLLPFWVHAQTITTVAGNGLIGEDGDGGPATAAKVNSPLGIAYDVLGNFYFTGNESNVIRKVNPAGIISTFAGIGTAGYSGDGGPASAAQFSGPQGISFDKYGNLFIADGDSGVIRKINTSGIISTVAGTGKPGYSGDNGPATDAQLTTPSDVKVDTAGNIYIADFKTNVVRKVNKSGIITKIAGTGTAGYTGDGGPATAATFDWPAAISLDSAGNLYIADYTNQVIRMINKKDTVSTVVGAMGGGFSGDGGPATAARLHGPWGITFDSSWNLFITDTYNNRIRKVNKSSGIITTVAGNGHEDSATHPGGYSGDGGPATAAALYWPAFVAIGSAGTFYITDESNHVVRKVDTSRPMNYLAVHQFAASENNIVILPNPNKGTFTIKSSLNSKNDADVSVEIRNMLGQVVYHTQLFARKGIINTRVILKEGLPDDMYLLHISSGTENETAHFIIGK